MNHAPTANVRLLPTERDTDNRDDSAGVSRWWFIAIIVLQMLLFVNVQHNRFEMSTAIEEQRREMRRELDEHSSLIKQLQERRVVNELMAIKRKGS